MPIKRKVGADAHFLHKISLEWNEGRKGEEGPLTAFIPELRKIDGESKNKISMISRGEREILFLIAKFKGNLIFYETSNPCMVLLFPGSFLLCYDGLALSPIHTAPILVFPTAPQ